MGNCRTRFIFLLSIRDYYYFLIFSIIKSLFCVIFPEMLVALGRRVESRPTSS